MNSKEGRGERKQVKRERRWEKESPFLPLLPISFLPIVEDLQRAWKLINGGPTIFKDEVRILGRDKSRIEGLKGRKEERKDFKLGTHHLSFWIHSNFSLIKGICGSPLEGLAT
jgi:hypothetical protein